MYSAIYSNSYCATYWEQEVDFELFMYIKKQVWLRNQLKTGSKHILFRNS